MPVIPKEPLDWLQLFRQQINVLFNVLSGIDETARSGEHECVPRVDVYETAESFVVEIDLPGVRREDVSASICCSTLIVEGKKQKEAGAPGTNYFCMERSFGRFCMTIEIPPSVDAVAASARFENGVLAIAFPLSQNQDIIRKIPIE